MMRSVEALLAITLALSLAGCGGAPYSLTMMPAPMIYAEEQAKAVLDDTAEHEPHPGLLYATSRPPTEDGAYPYYRDDRGDVIRLGHAKLTVRENDASEAEILALAAAADRERDLTLTLTGIEEFGLLERSLLPFSDPAHFAPGAPRGETTFAQVIDTQFERSGNREIFVYVHGYRVPFSNPVLVAAEFWHFLDYEGAFIAFSWPSTFNRWAYLTDLENADLSAHALRDLLEFLSEETSAERIHILGYSAGTRVVLDALHNIALEENGARPRLGQVVLTGSDVDRAILGLKLEDGVLDAVDSLTLYLSESDQALKILRFLGFRPRAGEMWEEGTMPPQVARYILEHPKLIFINVAEAEGSTRGNGHGYFRSSPWVSSDIIASFIHGLKPEARGLVLVEGEPIWRFPSDYPARLRRIRDASPPPEEAIAEQR